MTISEKEEELFKEWEKSRRPFVRDGVVSERDYLKSCPKIAFILKETNNPGFNDLREFLRDGGREESWNNVARWVHGIRNLPSEYEWFSYEEKTKTKAFRRETLKSIVVMNLKKSPGGSTANAAALKNVAKEDAPYIQKQYAIYDPDITICGGVKTGDLFWEALHRDSDMKWKQTTRGIWWYSRSAHKFVVAVPHPEARVQDSLLLYALLDAIKEIKENQDHDRPGNSR